MYCVFLGLVQHQYFKGNDDVFKKKQKKQNSVIATFERIVKKRFFKRASQEMNWS